MIRAQAHFGVRTGSVESRLAYGSPLSPQKLTLNLREEGQCFESVSRVPAEAKKKMSHAERMANLGSKTEARRKTNLLPEPQPNKQLQSYL